MQKEGCKGGQRDYMFPPLVHHILVVVAVASRATRNLLPGIPSKMGVVAVDRLRHHGDQTNASLDPDGRDHNNRTPCESHAKAAHLPDECATLLRSIGLDISRES